LAIATHNSQIVRLLYKQSADDYINLTDPMIILMVLRCFIYLGLLQSGNYSFVIVIDLLEQLQVLKKLNGGYKGLLPMTLEVQLLLAVCDTAHQPTSLCGDRGVQFVKYMKLYSPLGQFEVSV